MLVGIYKQDNGNVAVLIPTLEVLEQLGVGVEAVRQVCVKDVPAGKPFKIVSDTDIPSDRTFRSAWTVSESELTDGIGGESNEFQD